MVTPHHHHHHHHHHPLFGAVPTLVARRLMCIVYGAVLLAREGRTPAFLTLAKRVKAAIKRDVRDDITSRVRRQGPTSIFRNLRQVIEGGKSTQRAAPEATPTELNEYFVGVGPRVAAEVRDRGEPLHLPCRLPRVGACAFSLLPISLQSLRSVLFSMKNSSTSGSDGVSIRILKLFRRHRSRPSLFRQHLSHNL